MTDLVYLLLIVAAVVFLGPAIIRVLIGISASIIVVGAYLILIPLAFITTMLGGAPHDSRHR